MAKFLQLTDQNGGTFHTNPDSWAKFAPTQSLGTDKKEVTLTVIRYRDGTTDRVKETVEDIARMVAKS